MKISESELRLIIRSSLLNEVTSFGQNANYASIEDIADCPFYTEIPAKFANLFNTRFAGFFVSKLLSMMPSKKLKQFLGNDFETLGIGQGRNAGIVDDLDPKNIAEIMKSNNAIQIIAGYFNSYLYFMGTSCLAYYYLGEILTMIGMLLGDVDATAAGQRSKDNAASFSFKFTEGISERSKQLSRRSSDVISPFAFYALPRLAAEGTNHDDVDLLKKDLEDYQSKFNEIESINDDKPGRFFSAACRILNLKDTNFFITNEEKFKGHPANRDAVEEMKKDVKASLIVALREAVQAYETPMNNNSDFKQEVDNFFTRNNL